MDLASLRTSIDWSPAYRSEWDDSPGLYVDNGLAPWGKSRRLGLLRMGQVKAYIGVQHVDPSLPGWNIVAQPEARYFVSVLVGKRTTALRTFSTIRDALGFLLSLLTPPQN